MKLALESVQEFLDIYKKEFNKELSYVEAEEMGKELLDLYSILFKEN